MIPFASPLIFPVIGITCLSYTLLPRLLLYFLFIQVVYGLTMTDNVSPDISGEALTKPKTSSRSRYSILTVNYRGVIVPIPSGR
jgi:hypothetical protein